MNRTDKQVWVGLFTLAPTVRNADYGHYKGACVNALALSVDKAEFLDNVKEACSQMDFMVQEVEDVEPFSKRASEYNLDQRLIELAEEVEKLGVVKFGNFHTFQYDDA